MWGVLLTCGAVGVATLAGFAGRLSWLGELACHFRMQYALLSVATAAILAALRNYKFSLISGGIALVNLALIVPLYFPGNMPDANAKTLKLRILSLNVHTSNREYRRVIEYVREKSPDVAVFYEVSENWGNQLEQLSDLFPYHKTLLNRARPAFGLAIYSRLPLWDQQSLDLGGDNPAIIAEMILESKVVTIFGVHPDSPKSPSQTERRNRQLSQLGKLIAEETRPVILLGDLNTTSWSGVFQDLLRTTGLHDTRQGYGIEASWPSGLGRFGIPIDHCLVSPEIKVRRHQIGADVGSDHRPVVIDLLLDVE